MKKNILILCTSIIILSLMAFGFVNRGNPESNQIETPVSEDVATYTQAIEKIEKRIFSDFIYDVGPRFRAIKKGDLDNARSFNNFIAVEHAQRIVSYKSVSVIILKNDKQTDIIKTGTSDVFTPAQIKLLQSLDYSTNILIRADFQEKNKKTSELEDSYSTPHLTIVPEKQAEYEFGKEELIDYLKEKSKEVVWVNNVQEDKLQPAKLLFTVSKKGLIENVKLDRTSNYPSIDNAMIELINKAPGNWEPAENSKGEKVDQELVVSFGLMGC